MTARTDLPARLRSRLTGKARSVRTSTRQRVGNQRLEARVAALEEAVDENRRLNQRLADVVDVVTEVLVPAADRDDERLQQALARLGKTLGQDSDRS
jgi:C4-dicarboxylate-specific signal transduction histidine kinase